MRTFRSLSTAQKHIFTLKQKQKTIGFVPTMGALHDGHLSLIKKSRRENDITVASIFVNPTQFRPNEDLAKYPREEKKDKLLLKKEKVNIIIYPTVEEMYPRGYLTYVEVKNLSDHLCGKSRPGHFKGVATVVSKLLNIAQPDKIYLGQKDIQQVVIIRRMIQDLNFKTTVRICPTVRENSGLAFSSRNKYLSLKHKKEASEIYKTLKAAKAKIKAGEKSTGNIIQFIKSALREKTSGKIDYIECVEALTLQPIKTFKGNVIIALAVYFGQARLIDNVMIRIS